MYTRLWRGLIEGENAYKNAKNSLIYMHGQLWQELFESKNAYK